MTALRLMALAAVLLALAYAGLWRFLRASQTERLRAEWRATRPPLPEWRYVSNGLEAQAPGLRWRLGMGVVVLPLTALGAVVWFSEVGG